jgi:hypothetical protein
MIRFFFRWLFCTILLLSFVISGFQVITWILS